MELVMDPLATGWAVPAITVAATAPAIAASLPAPEPDTEETR